MQRLKENNAQSAFKQFFNDLLVLNCMIYYVAGLANASNAMVDVNRMGKINDILGGQISKVMVSASYAIGEGCSIGDVDLSLARSVFQANLYYIETGDYAPLKAITQSPFPS